MENGQRRVEREIEFEEFREIFSVYDLIAYQIMFSWDAEEEEQELVGWVEKKGIVREKGSKVCVVEYKWWLEWYLWLKAGRATANRSTASRSSSRRTTSRTTPRPRSAARKAGSPSPNSSSPSTKPPFRPQGKSRTDVSSRRLRTRAPNCFLTLSSSTTSSASPRFSGIS